MLINRKYFRTFFDARTASEFLCDTWRSSTTDIDRCYIFNKHKILYKSINKEIKVWLTDNWNKWEDDMPEWFNSKMIEQIPIELIPDKILEKGGSNKIVKERKKTLTTKFKERENSDIE